MTSKSALGQRYIDFVNEFRQGADYIHKNFGDLAARLLELLAYLQIPLLKTIAELPHAGMQLPGQFLDLCDDRNVGLMSL